MHLFTFKEWLSKDSPPNAGDIWDDHSNSELAKKGIKSKNSTSEKPFKSKMNPENLFLGKCKKK